MQIYILLKKFSEFIIPRKFHLSIRYIWLKINSKLDPEMKYVLKIIKRKRKFIDIGANVGIYTYFFANKFNTIEAFEPISEITYRIDSLKKNNIKVHSVALSNNTGLLEFYIPKIKGGIEPSLASLEKKDGLIDVRKVSVKQLDTYNFNDVDLIKIDVEGHEYQTILGAKSTLLSSRPLLIIEIEQRHIERPIEDVFALLSTFQYEGYFLKNHNLISINEFSFELHQKPYLSNVMHKNYINNFIFIPQDY